MKKLFFIFVIAAVLAGCGTAHESYVDATYDYLVVAVPQHVKYIEADTTLSDFDKKARIAASQEVLEMATEEKERLK